MPFYDHLSKDELVRLLKARDDRDSTRLGLVWEANEIDREEALNSDFVALDLVPEIGTPAEDSPEGWRNLIIEGDNFDALRYLRMTHSGRIKCILIDPPYNTGKKDFVYNDSFVDVNDSWRFSKWLEFLFQRLVIARDLLTPDGVMFVCINDENRSKLELLLEKVMPGRRVGSFVWRTRSGANDSKEYFRSMDHEHVLCYANPEFNFAGKKKSDAAYTNPDGDKRGPWNNDYLVQNKNYKQRKNTFYPIHREDKDIWYACDPDNVWRFSSELRLKPGQQIRSKTMEQIIREEKVLWPQEERTVKYETKAELISAIEDGTAPRNLRLGNTPEEQEFWDGRPGVTRVSPQGQIELLGLEPQETGGGKSPFEDEEEDDGSEDFKPTEDFNFSNFFGEPPKDKDDPKDTGIRSGSARLLRYPLKSGMPKVFKTQLASPNNEVTEEDCANRFIVSTRELFEVLKSRVPVERRTLNVFTQEMQQEFNFAADISPSQAARTAEKILTDNKIFDPRELRLALLRKMAMVMREETMPEAEDPEKVGYFLDVILTTHPGLLRDAQKQALAGQAEILDAAELPEEHLSDEILSTSPKNIYGIVPQMNNWEVLFAEILDSDPNGIVKWWHRNPSQKPWSVNVLMTNGKGFFPDFVVGIEGRRTEGGILLADPKERFETSREAPKIHAEHKTYGKVLILAKDGARWMTVEYDPKAKKPIANREFRLSDTPGF